MPKYKEIQVLGNSVIVRENEDGSVSSFIKDEANADYQQYLKDTQADA